MTAVAKSWTVFITLPDMVDMDGEKVPGMIVYREFDSERGARQCKRKIEDERAEIGMQGGKVWLVGHYDGSLFQHARPAS